MSTLKRLIALIHFILSFWKSQAQQSVFNTSRRYEFQYQNIICSNETDCLIICDEPGACIEATITCPVNHRCDITCIGPFFGDESWDTQFLCYGVCIYTY